MQFFNLFIATILAPIAFGLPSEFATRSEIIALDRTNITVYDNPNWSGASAGFTVETQTECGMLISFALNLAMKFS